MGVDTDMDADMDTVMDADMDRNMKIDMNIRRCCISEIGKKFNPM
jgi:hypothetical protein